MNMANKIAQAETYVINCLKYQVDLEEYKAHVYREVRTIAKEDDIYGLIIYCLFNPLPGEYGSFTLTFAYGAYKKEQWQQMFSYISGHLIQNVDDYLNAINDETSNNKILHYFTVTNTNCNSYGNFDL